MFEHDDDDPVLRRLVAEERAVLDATELICEVLDGSGTSRSELARRLGVGPAEITHRLRGRNLTVKSLAATLDALDHRLHISAVPREKVTIPLAPVRWLVTSAHEVPAGSGRAGTPEIAMDAAGVYRLAV